MFARACFRPILIAALLVAAATMTARAQGLPFRDVVVPPSDEHPEGMLTIESEPDTYVAIYKKDVVYATRGERELHLQLLMPEDRSGLLPAAERPTIPARPVIVYVQGSAWMPQALYAAIPQLADFAHAGYVVASVEYRPSTEARAPAQIQDVKSAIRYLRANAAKYNIDPDRIGIWGDSSGGHMAALAGVSDGFKPFSTDDNPDQSSAVRAVVDFYGPTDFTKMSSAPSRLDHDAADSPGSRVVGGPIQEPEQARAVRAYNPIAHITAGKTLPPFLIMHGDRDALVPFNQSVLLYEALRDAGQDVTFYKVAGADHGVRFWTPAVMAVVIDFFDTHLNPRTTQQE
ncbi:MAG: alpha/beta hydrolase [Rhodothermales bacterium]